MTPDAQEDAILRDARKRSSTPQDAPAAPGLGLKDEKGLGFNLSRLLNISVRLYSKKMKNQKSPLRVPPKAPRE